MRHLIACFLLFLLPTQFAFAAAAGYCSLENVEVPSHFGHHDHADAAPVADTENQDTDAADSKCGVCHLGCAKVQLSEYGIAAVPIVRTENPMAKAPRADHPQEPSERPPRSLLA